MEDEGYDLKWKNHLKDVFGVLQLIRAKEAFSDVILYCDNELFHAHKVILAACSTFFERMLSALPAEKSKVLVMTETDSKMLGLVLDFMYDGEVYLDADHLDCFMETAEKLEIRGLKKCPSDDAAKGESDHSESMESSRKRDQSSVETGEGGEKENSKDDFKLLQSKRLMKGKPSGIANSNSVNLPGSMALKTGSIPSSPLVSQPSVSGYQSLTEPHRMVDVPGPSGVQSLHPSLESDDDLFEVDEGGIKVEAPEEFGEEESVDEEGNGNEEPEHYNEEGADTAEDGEQYNHDLNDSNVGDAEGEERPEVIPPEVSSALPISLWKPGTLVWRGLNKTGRSAVTFCGKCGYASKTSERVLSHTLFNHKEYSAATPGPFDCRVCSKRLSSKASLKTHCLNKHGMKREDVDHMFRMNKGNLLGTADKNSVTLPAPIASETASIPPSPRVSQPSVSGYQSPIVPLRRVDAPGPSGILALHPNLESDDSFEIDDEDGVQAGVQEERREDESVEEEGEGYEEAEHYNEEGADIEEDGEQCDHDPNDPNVGQAEGEVRPEVVPPEVSVARGISLWKPDTLVWRGITKTGRSATAFCGKCGYARKNSQQVLDHTLCKHKKSLPGVPGPLDCPVCLKGFSSKTCLKNHCLKKHGMKHGDDDNISRSRKRVQPSMKTGENGEDENSHDDLNPLQSKRMKKGEPLGIANKNGSKLRASASSKTSSTRSSARVSQPSVSGHRSLTVGHRKEADEEEHDYDSNVPNVSGMEGGEQPEVIPPEFENMEIKLWKPGTPVWRGVTETGRWSIMAFCGKCGFASPWPYDVLKHANKHLEHQPYVCPVCSLGFSTKWNLKSHCVKKHKMRREQVVV